MRIDWAGEGLELLPERAVWWPRERTLFIADLHLGKAAAFRHAGIPVPGGTTAVDLARLGALIRRCAPARLTILGDLLHAPTGRAAETMDQVRAWRASHASLHITLVRGNHDERSGDPPADWGIECADAPLDMPPFTLLHDPAPLLPPHPPCARFALAGHLHPGVLLQRADGRAGAMRERCFWLSDRHLVLPAFGAMTGLRAVRPRAGDRVFIIGAGAVHEVRGVIAR